MVASGLKLFLPDIISPTQSAFVRGRLITDNVLVAYECFHTIKRKKEGKEDLFAIKLDMHKAYDRVEWPFIKDIMIKLGFHENWVNFIMQCVSTFEYRTRFNTEEIGSFKPTRGLRQGYPMSPYLFILCTEVLTALLTQAEETGGISGVKVCRDAPPVTNLLFGDDSLILM
uniref:Reverse transcriptase domain-containing protein n=1 Tax=Hordeum vulgare subsp. vulgare TaxID=112509 RepID=A0A8I6YFT0_HORVV